MKLIDYFLMPADLMPVRVCRKMVSFKYLDVGCGNHKASQVKRYFPQARYYGLDCCNYNNDEGDYGLMEAFFEADLERDDLSVVPDGLFDFVMFCQVIEHLRDGEVVLRRLCGKLAENGCIYVEFPGRHSVGWWTRVFPFFHFSTDASHVRLYSFGEVASALADCGMEIVAKGNRYDWRKFVALPFLIPYNICLFLSRSDRLGAGLWHVFPRSEFVFARKRGGGSRACAELQI